MAIQIMEIRISPAVEFKLRSKHHLTGEIVREAIQYPSVINCEWVSSHKLGRRLIVRGETIQNRQIVAVLHQANFDLGVWNLATAWIELRKNS